MTLSPLGRRRAHQRQTANLGFNALRNLIPEQVGECLESEHYNEIGDSVLTTGGLMVRRKEARVHRWHTRTAPMENPVRPEPVNTRAQQGEEPRQARSIIDVPEDQADY